MGFYRDRIFARVMNRIMNTKETRRIRAEVCAPLHGEVVEIGFGTGLNLPHIPAAVTRLHAVDPLATGPALARERLAASSVPVEFIGLDGQRIPLEDQCMDVAAIYILLPALFILAFAGASVVVHAGLSSRLNDGPHGLSEIVYAFTSAFNNNGSAFGGLSANTAWYDTTLGMIMWAGRLFAMVPMLAIVGSLARKQPVPATAASR